MGVGWWVPLDTCPLKPSGALRAHKIRTKSTSSARGQVNARPKVTLDIRQKPKVFRFENGAWRECNRGGGAEKAAAGNKRTASCTCSQHQGNRHIFHAMWLRFSG